jgi:pyroglutamyl-peptidase
MIGLVTGSQPFAGLPSNPAEMVLGQIEGLTIDGVRIVTRATPVSYAQLPRLLTDLVAEYRPAFVLALGLALGAPILRVEKVAINAADFGVADNEGARPRGGRSFAPNDDVGRFATWDAGAVVEAILEAGVPARASYHAGTHLCNLTLYTYLAALAGAGLEAPCGFLHLPYLPEQIVWMMRHRTDSGEAPGRSFDQPSMALETQIVAVKAALGALARQARKRVLSSASHMEDP